MAEEAVDLEKELRKWQEDRAAKAPRAGERGPRTVRVNGQDVMVLRKKQRVR